MTPVRLDAVTYAVLGRLARLPDEPDMRQLVAATGHPERGLWQACRVLDRLDRLRAAEWVACRFADEPWPRRRLYRLTLTGRARVAELVHSGQLPR